MRSGSTVELQKARASLHRAQVLTWLELWRPQLPRTVSSANTEVIMEQIARSEFVGPWEAYASERWIARGTGLAVSTVSKAMSWLARHGMAHRVYGAPNRRTGRAMPLPTPWLVLMPPPRWWSWERPRKGRRYPPRETRQQIQALISPPMVPPSDLTWMPDPIGLGYRARKVYLSLPAASKAELTRRTGFGDGALNSALESLAEHGLVIRSGARGWVHSGKVPTPLPGAVAAHRAHLNSEAISRDRQYWYTEIEEHDLAREREDPTYIPSWKRRELHNSPRLLSPRGA